LAAINAVTGKLPIAVGKPHKYLFDCIVEQNCDIDPKRTVMIGDRLTTDMVFGAINGLKTLFVQSGISSKDDMIKYYNSKTPTEHIFVPNFYLKSLNDFNKYI
jgi:ribonucleotide monophosphatase NagD (HAD superfamily)